MYKKNSVTCIAISIVVSLIFLGGCFVHAHKNNEESKLKMNFFKSNLNTSSCPFIYGTYVRKDLENCLLILDPKGTYSIQFGNNRSTEDFEIDPNDTITFKTWGDREGEEIQFGGNILVDPDEYEWIKQLTNDDVSGVYFGQENQKNVLNLQKDGFYEGQLDSHKLSGKYRVVQDKIILSFKEDNIELRCCSCIWGYGHAILCNDATEPLFKDYDKKFAVKEYIHHMDNTKSLTIYRDGFFFLKFGTTIMNGRYENDKKHIELFTGNRQYCPFEKSKRGIIVDGEEWINSK